MLKYLQELSQKCDNAIISFESIEKEYYINFEKIYYLAKEPMQVLLEKRLPYDQIDSKVNSEKILEELATEFCYKLYEFRAKNHMCRNKQCLNYVEYNDCKMWENCKLPKNMRGKEGE